MKIKMTIATGLLGCLTVAGMAKAQPEATSMPESEVLLAKPVTLPSQQIVAKVIRIRFPVGFKTPEHIHKGPGPRYVLQGRVRITDRQSSEVYGPGQVFWESGAPMFAENAGEEVAELLIFEMAGAEKSAGSAPGKNRKIIIKPH